MGYVNADGRSTDSLLPTFFFSPSCFFLFLSIPSFRVLVSFFLNSNQSFSLSLPSSLSFLLLLCSCFSLLLLLFILLFSFLYTSFIPFHSFLPCSRFSLSQQQSIFLTPFFFVSLPFLYSPPFPFFSHFSFFFSPSYFFYSSPLLSSVFSFLSFSSNQSSSCSPSLRPPFPSFLIFPPSPFSLPSLPRPRTSLQFPILMLYAKTQTSKH